MSRIYFDTRPGWDDARRPLVNPYFVNLASRRRMCPSCHAATVWSGTNNPDVAMESCPKCGWFQAQEAQGAFEGARCDPVGAESAISVDLVMDEAKRRRRLGAFEERPAMGEVIQFRPRGR